MQTNLYHLIHLMLFGMSCLLGMTGCNQVGTASAPTPPVLHETPTSATVASPTPPETSLALTTTPLQTSGWLTIHPGIDWRTVPVESGTLRVLRLDPAKVRLRVAYDPQAPMKISEWMGALDPLVVINGGFFEPTYEASALTVADGNVTGQSYEGYGGMLAVTQQDEIVLHSLVDQPYTPNGAFVQAVQSFPGLVWDGHAVQLQNDNGHRARRTVVAMDTAGRLLLMVTDEPLWSLTELGHWLEHSDLMIDDALNLDGGPSTGIAVNTPSFNKLIDSVTPLPQVLVIEAR